MRKRVKESKGGERSDSRVREKGGGECERSDVRESVRVRDERESE
jgi:hypothetical protein